MAINQAREREMSTTTSGSSKFESLAILGVKDVS